MFDDNTEDLDLEFHEDGYRERKLKVNGKDFVLRSSDPFGLWTIHNSKGGVPPKELEGSFTTADLAIVAVERYMGDYKFPNPENPNTERTMKRVLTPKEPQVV